MSTRIPNRLHTDQRGVLIVEALIGLFCGLLVVLILVQIALNTKKSQSINFDLSQANYNVQSALHTLAKSVKLAGAFGIDRELISISSDIQVPTTLSGNICDTNWLFDIDNYIIAFEGTANTAMLGQGQNCLIAGGSFYAADTDVLILRYANQSNLTPTIDLNSPDLNNQYYIRNYLGGDFLPILSHGQDIYDNFLSDETSNIISPQIVYNMAFQTEIYYVRNCARFDNNANCLDETPSLVRVHLNDGNIVESTIARSVVDFQLEFGIDNDGVDLLDNALNTTGYVTPNLVNNWNEEVLSARVAIIVIGEEQSNQAINRLADFIPMIGDKPDLQITTNDLDKHQYQQLFVQSILIRSHGRFL